MSLLYKYKDSFAKWLKLLANFGELVARKLPTGQEFGNPALARLALIVYVILILCFFVDLRGCKGNCPADDTVPKYINYFIGDAL